MFGDHIVFGIELSEVCFESSCFGGSKDTEFGVQVLGHPYSGLVFFAPVEEVFHYRGHGVRFSFYKKEEAAFIETRQPS